MPNWCEGTLKIRGDYEAIKRFAAQGIQKTEVVYEGPEDEETDFQVYDIGYIKGTMRGFVQSEIIDIRRCDEHPEKGICAFNYKEAWMFGVEEWKKNSKEYGFDVKILAIESGMQFVQDVLIENGEIKKYTCTDYKGLENWLWECPFPLMGG